MRTCSECKSDGTVQVTDQNGSEYWLCERHDAHARGKPCEDHDCQECCPHDDFDHGICLDCGLDKSEDFAAAAYDRAKDRMKYGE